MAGGDTMTRHARRLLTILRHTEGHLSRTKYAGIAGVHCGAWAVHFGVREDFRRWGADTGGWWDGPIHEYGAGPLVLACWMAALEDDEDEVSLPSPYDIACRLGEPRRRLRRKLSHLQARIWARDHASCWCEAPYHDIPDGHRAGCPHLFDDPVRV